MRTEENIKYKEAKDRVESLKGFYKHATIYLIINSLLIGYRFYRYSSRSNNPINEDFYTWIDWNVFGTAIFWGIGLLFHGLYVFQFKSGFMRKWEQRKLAQFMKEEESSRDATFKF